MLFNSNIFLFFLPVVFVTHWLLNTKRQQNFLLLISSYIFYGWWDYRFLSLIIISTLTDFYLAQRIHSCVLKNNKRKLLYISFIINLGFLGVFKYFNFFVDSFIQLFDTIGVTIEDNLTLNILLPVGISFYTFQTLSYSIDTYKGSIKPSNNLLDFGAYVAFFPQLVAGPIERATNFLPQISNRRQFSYKQGVQGLRLILWGMFKKVVVADSLSPFVNNIFDNHYLFDGGTLALGMIYFSFQIYCDFSGYSDIAIGSAKLFGIELMSNFRFPYFSRNISEFWRRWHISLSTWFRDYLYIPLGGSRGPKMEAIRNIFIIFIVSGFWHGANWTFVIWGLFHSLLFLPSFLLNTNRKYLNQNIKDSNPIEKFLDILKIIRTFLLVSIGWIFFRSQSLQDAIEIIKSIIFNFSIPQNQLQGLGYIFWFLIFDFINRKDERNPFKLVGILRYPIYLFLFYQIINHWNLNQGAFIYFDF